MKREKKLDQYQKLEAETRWSNFSDFVKRQCVFFDEILILYPAYSGNRKFPKKEYLKLIEWTRDFYNRIKAFEYSHDLNKDEPTDAELKDTYEIDQESIEISSIFFGMLFKTSPELVPIMKKDTWECPHCHTRNYVFQLLLPFKHNMFNRCFSCAKLRTTGKPDELKELMEKVERLKKSRKAIKKLKK